MSNIWYENNKIPANIENNIEIEIEDCVGKIGKWITVKDGYTDKHKIITFNWRLIKKWRFINDEQDVIDYLIEEDEKHN